MKNRCVKFKDGLLFRRTNLIEGFEGSVVMKQKGEPLTMNVNEDAYIVLDLLDEGKSIDECISIVSDETGEDAENIKTGICSFVDKFVDNGYGEYISSEDILLKQNQVRKAINLNSYYSVESASIELLSRCNLKCRHCYGEFGAGSSDVLSKNTVLDLLDQLSDLHCKEISFTGGEVMLYPDFYEVLEYAAEKRFALSFLTNGTLVNEAFVEDLGKIGPLEIQISLDGHKAEIHDEFRGVKGAYGKSVRGLKLLGNAGFDMMVSQVVNIKNQSYLSNMESFIKDMGIGFKYGPMLKFGNGETCGRKYYLSPEEYYATLTSFGKRKDDGITKGVASDYIERCSAGAGRFSVKSNGNVLPCEVLPDIERFRMGNIYDGKLEDFVLDFSRKEAFGTMNAIDLDDCSGCAHIVECKGGCLAASFSEYGKTDVADPFACARTMAQEGEGFKKIAG